MQNSTINDYTKRYDKGFVTLSLDSLKEPLNWLHFFPTECAQDMNVGTFLPYYDFPLPYAFLSGRHLCLQENKPRLTTRYLVNQNVPMFKTAKGKTTVIRGQRCHAAVKALAKKAQWSLRLDLSDLPRSEHTKLGQYAWPLRLRLTEDLALCGFLCSHRGRNSIHFQVIFNILTMWLFELLVKLFLWKKGPQRTNEWYIVHCVRHSFQSVSHFPWHK